MLTPSSCVCFTFSIQLGRKIENNKQNYEALKHKNSKIYFLLILVLKDLFYD